ncbi:hypothetical protein QT971_16320 [Microcoleus sp. herbarium19]|uniref:hypothetical protein n=1 Tax=Microcoleus sp. herbarium13 TaxID=3055438 RepID=UPI002FD1F0CA
MGGTTPLCFSKSLQEADFCKFLDFLLTFGYFFGMWVDWVSKNKKVIPISDKLKLEFLKQVK